MTECTWQPIETAPKDGTAILAINSRLSWPPVVVRWGHDEGCDPHWCDAATPSGEALYFNGNYLDYWQPVPEPPHIPGEKEPTR